MDVRLPDGTIIRGVPDGMSKADLTAKLARNGYDVSKLEAKEPSLMDDIKQGAGNLAAGLVRGAGSIGATILAPIDIAKDALDGKGLSLESNRQRRADMDAGLRTLGADTDSWMYKGGKLAGEVAGTAGAGGVLANGVRAVAPGATGLANALASGGMTTGAKAAPLFSKAGGVNMLTRTAGGTTTGAASAGLVSPEDAGLGALIGGGLPIGAVAAGGVGRTIGKAVRGGPVAPEVASLVQRAKELGIDIPADRIVDSKPMNALASSLNYVPFSGRAGTEAKMASQLNTALSRTFGQNSDNVTQALRKASADLGGKFDEVLTKNVVKVDDELLKELAMHEQTAMNELGQEGANIIKKQIDEILSKGANGQIDGQAAYNIKKTLDRIGKRNSNEAHYATELRKSLMGALNRSLPAEEAAAFAKTRQQYGNMLSLENLAQNGVEGEISIARLANMKNIRSKDLQELADISAQFLKSREGQHGAMQRAVAGMAAGTLGGVPTLAAGALAGRGTNMLLNSNLARNAVLGVENPMITNNLNKLLGIGYRTAPVLSAQ
jgi:hypothetical protein